ncbi:pyruvate, phosphate dikinase [Acidimicrobiia bacterium]|jgi:pyruvate,orthophosphate dikinase|nr:pyruvate, phosphate dikinase [Acidimicrobiia bacterium]MDB4814008.1 pyruvate, phosphate dikinase [Acidimicrobiia bacterium]MDC0977996.1 pyruvate, phosphate dikinase [Acidimicrobiia bacterium]MDC2961864.1 pyruvate, phosphate dikinase [Acidimicrobiia bacterium]MDC3277996.1 pyruvate, phosphate dikinase [Acidimicrobiia bacterium]|tara:strand:- start:628 stop:3276 length:2649 start_codon:yes stop_codon:yes gene_type:complete
MNTHPIYKFSQHNTDGDASLVDLLGGKGANLAEMSNMGINVPPGFTITTEVCNYFIEHASLPDGLEDEIRSSVKELEALSSKTFGNEGVPLLLSVRSGGKISMPGMMDSILNIGLNDENVQNLAEAFDDERFALDSYRRLIQMYSNVVLGLEHERFEAVIANKKRMDNVESDADFNVEQLNWIIDAYKNTVERFSNAPFPQDPYEQLLGAVEAVFSSWLNNRAVTYRKINNIPDTWGTGATIQTMVFGNLNEKSGTGVAFTRNPSTGDKELYGEYLMNAQGEDVVAGLRTPLPITNDEKGNKNSLEENFPTAYKEILETAGKLENHFKEVQDIEFTIEDEQIYLLQTRKAKRTAQASVKIAIDMEAEGIVSKEDAILMVDANNITNLLHPQFIESQERDFFDKALNASPGAAVGEIVFDADKAEEEATKGRDVILVRDETSPEDIHGMHSSVGILTTKGGMTSHAAVVARGMGKPCVVGAENLIIDFEEKTISNGTTVLHEGDLISLDGTLGEVYVGELESEPPKPSSEFNTLMEWANNFKRMKVRANAETAQDTTKALEFGAEGIGLCRTEHMFFEGERITPMREMIMSDSTQGRKRALSKLIGYQISDFESLFKLLKEKPITVRLLDPPMHEFLPKSDLEMSDLASAIGVSPGYVREMLLKLSESNPMLGHRGVRLGLSYPEIYKMQVEAILRAAYNLYEEDGVKVTPEIMIPLVMNPKELQQMKEILVRKIKKLEKKLGFEFTYSIGTMIELPSAALNSEAIAEHADFFSFGTNDLTQTTLGLSRDDASKFLNEYIERNIFGIDPFVSIDVDTVGKLVEMSVQGGRKRNKDIKIGVCGEHAGEANSILFLNTLDIDYISCSPFRIPTARLAAAQAEIVK